MFEKSRFHKRLSSLLLPLFFCRFLLDEKQRRGSVCSCLVRTSRMYTYVKKEKRKQNHFFYHSFPGELSKEGTAEALRKKISNAGKGE